MNTRVLPEVWNLDQLRTPGQTVEQELDQVESTVQAFVKEWKQREDWLHDPTVLRQALDAYEILNRFSGTSGKVGLAVVLRHAIDQENPAALAEYNSVIKRSTELTNLLQFFELRLAKIPQELQHQFRTDPQLSEYRHFLERLFVAGQYELSESEEAILNLKHEGGVHRWTQLTEQLLSGETRVVVGDDGVSQDLPLPALSGLLQSPQPHVRDQAAAGINDIAQSLSKVATAELNAVLLDKEQNDTLRHFIRPDASRHLSDDVDSATVDAMLAAVSGAFAISQKYYQFKAQLLGRETLKYHERALPYGTIHRQYGYLESVELVERVLTHLDPTFAEVLQNTAQQGRIDVAPRLGKQGGAFCMHWLISTPSFILLNHNNRLNDVLTLAHETGHNINNVLIAQTQNALNADTPIFTAEVASTFFEDFVLQALQQEASDEERLQLAVMKLDSDIATIFRQVACYQFEQDLHRQYRAKHYLATEEINTLFSQHIAAYLGPVVELTPGTEYNWVQWSHIRYYFYVSSYASGLLISKALQAQVAAHPTAIIHVKEFLAAGTSAAPREIFKRLGIDITDPSFWQLGLSLVEEQLGAAQQLAARLGKISA